MEILHRRVVAGVGAVGRREEELVWEVTSLERE